MYINIYYVLTSEMNIPFFMLLSFKFQDCKTLIPVTYIFYIFGTPISVFGIVAIASVDITD